MIKKIFITALIALASTTAIAKPTNISTIKLSNNSGELNIYPWYISNPSNGVTIAAPGKNRVVIIYVNKRLSSNPFLTSDPVRINCNGVPKIINPGTSAVCEIPANYSTAWELEPGFYRYGSDGSVASVE